MRKLSHHFYTRSNNFVHNHHIAEQQTCTSNIGATHLWKTEWMENFSSFPPRHIAKNENERKMMSLTIVDNNFLAFFFSFNFATLLCCARIFPCERESEGGGKVFIICLEGRIKEWKWMMEVENDFVNGVFINE